MSYNEDEEEKLDTNYSASIATGMASTMIFETRPGSERMPDYKMRSIVSFCGVDYPNHEQVIIGEELLRQYYLGYLDVQVDISGLEGPVYHFNMNEPS